MEYQELVITLAARTSYTRREIRNIVRALSRVIKETLEDGRDVQIWGLGRFRNVGARPRVGRHPITGDVIHIPATRKVKFEPNTTFKNNIKDSAVLFKKESLETKYGLPKREKRHGKVRG